MTENTSIDQHLNVLAVRGTGFPEECLRSDAVESLVSLTQANDTFTERAELGAMSCIAVGPAWGSEESYLTQVLQQARENTGVLIPEGDLKLAHFVGAYGLQVFETYAEQSDWTGLINRITGTLHQLVSNSATALPVRNLLFPLADSANKWSSVTLLQSDARTRSTCRPS